MIVVDASVAAKWFLPEKGSEAALELLARNEELAAPSLIRLEVSAALTRRVRLQELPPEEALRQCQEWAFRLDQGAVTLIPDEQVLLQAIDLSLHLYHPLQDCLYLAVARHLNAPLLTADRSFHNRAKSIDADIALLPGCQTN